MFGEFKVAALCTSRVYDYIPYDRVDVLIIMDEKIKSHRIVREIIDKAKSYDKPVTVLDGSYEGCNSVRFDFFDEVFISVPGVTTVDCELTELAEMTAKVAVRSTEGEDVLYRQGRPVIR